MNKYIDIIQNSFSGYYNYLVREILNPHWGNYFYWLIAISLVFWSLEIITPWRRNQSKIRKDFWLDAFYMFFNFFIFSIVISGVYKIIGLLFGEINITAKSLALFDISEWAPSLQLFVFFIILDFVQWFTHVLLHRYGFLWKFLVYFMGRVDTDI